MAYNNTFCRNCFEYGKCKEGADCAFPRKREKYESAKARDEFDNGFTYIAKGYKYPLSCLFNNNYLINGGTGTGKTSTIVKRNLMEPLGSIITSDPKGNLYKEFCGILTKKGYNVVRMPLSNPGQGIKYNPLENIGSTQDILTIAEIIVNEQRSAGTKADPFWDQTAILLVSAIIGYMFEMKYKPFTFTSILKFLREGIRSDDEGRDSPLAARFARHRKLHPDSWACDQYDLVELSANRTYASVAISLASKFAKFDTLEIREMMSGNDIDLVDIGKRKTAVFVTVSDTDRSMDDLANIFFTQALQALCRYADNECEDCRLPVPVRFILDDFATNCRIDEFPRMISTIRSRGISAMLMIQAESQLTQYYDHNANTIIANCDTYVYLGGNDLKSAEFISKRSNRPLSEILSMPLGTCWIFRRGEQPVFAQLLERPDQLNEREL